MTSFAATATFATSTYNAPAVFFVSLIESMQASDGILPNITTSVLESMSVADLVDVLSDVFLSPCRQSRVKKQNRMLKVRCR